jgi:hypothetical protein
MCDVCLLVHFLGPPCGSATCLLGATSTLHDFASRNFKHPSFGLSPSEPPSSRDPLISATCPPPMDGLDYFVTSLLVTSSTQVLGSHPMNLRVHEIPLISATCPPPMDGLDYFVTLLTIFMKLNDLPSSNAESLIWVISRHVSFFRRMTQISSPPRDFTFRDFVSLVTKVSTLHLPKSRDVISRVIQRPSLVRILRSDFPDLALDECCRNSPTPL